ncbi:hypothetical protein SAMN05421849_1881 [Pontibaca methylaminivorans]|uniref:Glycosyl transferase family 2 n=2 Tax=Pontibaca methylaminivorans TaxID=515897 RepID=A0A1R3WYK3_9RHOB|nr:hypothetical protein SAMN05421849_1881 [Pontibaca methylaminivorans]
MIGDTFRQFKHRRRLARARAELHARPDGGAAHGLPGRLVVSLTSYPARFGTLGLTLACLLRQTVRPDRIILWLADDDLQHLPAEVASLPGVDVLTCPDFRSYNKIVPTLLLHPDAFVVTADDDVYYPHGWLAGLVAAASAGAPVACHRAHRVVLRGAGPASYDVWQHNMDRPEHSPMVFPTGVSGVIYAPGIFHSDVVRDDLFTTLAPTSDDIWLYWMYRLNGIDAQKIGHRVRILEWQGSQGQSLRDANTQGTGNDRALAAMIAHYGWPG